MGCGLFVSDAEVLAPALLICRRRPCEDREIADLDFEHDCVSA